MPALIAGVPAPKFKLPDLESSQFSLEEALKHATRIAGFLQDFLPDLPIYPPLLGTPPPGSEREERARDHWVSPRTIRKIQLRSFVSMA